MVILRKVRLGTSWDSSLGFLGGSEILAATVVYDYSLLSPTQLTGTPTVESLRRITNLISSLSLNSIFSLGEQRGSLVLVLSGLCWCSVLSERPG